MKKPTKLRILFSAFMISALATLSGCYISLDDDNFHCINGRGAIETETYNMSEFSRISNSIDATIRITTGSINHRITVSARRNILDEVNVRTRGGELIIESDRCIDNGDIEIDIFLTELRGLFNTGSGDISGTNSWETNNMTLNLSGSGKIDALTDVSELDISISGSGDIELSGSTQEVKLSIAGSGNLEAFGLEANSYDVNIAGSGSTEIFVLDELRGSISGSGKIHYKGDPNVVSVTITGSGRVVDSN